MNDSHLVHDLLHCNLCELSPCLWIQIGFTVVEKCNVWETVQESQDPNNWMTNMRRRFFCYQECSRIIHGHVGTGIGYTLPLPSCVEAMIREIYPDDYYRGYTRFGKNS